MPAASGCSKLTDAVAADCKHAAAAAGAVVAAARNCAAVAAGAGVADGSYAVAAHLGDISVLAADNIAALECIALGGTRSAVVAVADAAESQDTGCCSVAADDIVGVGPRRCGDSHEEELVMNFHILDLG